MSAESAITLCGLDGTVKRSTLYYKVQYARANGVYDSVLKRKAERILKTLDDKKVAGLVINVDEDDDEISSCSRNDDLISPVTTATTLTSLSSDACTTVTTTTRSSRSAAREGEDAGEKKRYRSTSKQASVGRLDGKRCKEVDYKGRF